MKVLQWSNEALRDLSGIHTYIASDSQVYADRVIEKLLQHAERASRHPESGRSVPELQLPWLREFIVGNYRLIYRATGETIYIVAVVHGSRDLTRLKDSLS